MSSKPNTKPATTKKKDELTDSALDKVAGGGSNSAQGGDPTDPDLRPGGYKAP